MFCRCMMALCLLLGASSIFAAQPVDTPENRAQAATMLFELPTFRQLATRQIHESIKFLPEQQYRRAIVALSNPNVVQTLRDAIVRSMTQTFTVIELQSLRRWLSSEEMRSIIGKLGGFEAVFTRELLTAAITNPELGEIMLGK